MLESLDTLVPQLAGYAMPALNVVTRSFNESYDRARETLDNVASTIALGGPELASVVETGARVAQCGLAFASYMFPGVAALKVVTLAATFPVVACEVIRMRTSHAEVVAALDGAPGEQLVAALDERAPVHAINLGLATLPFAIAIAARA